MTIKQKINIAIAAIPEKTIKGEAVWLQGKWIQTDHAMKMTEDIQKKVCLNLDTHLTYDIITGILKRIGKEMSKSKQIVPALFGYR